jgi:hypothetical protein
MTGRLHEVDDVTWAAFMQHYGAIFSPEMEREFLKQIRSRPMHWMHHSKLVELLFFKDFEL